MLPSRKAVRDLLTERTGRAVALGPGPLYAPGAHDRATFGVYVDQQMRTRGLVVCDLWLSALAGGAMAAFPVGGAEDEIDRRRLGPRTQRHLEDLLEALTGLFEPGPGVALRLHAIHHAGGELPGDLPAFAHALGARLDLRVDLAGYGSGRLSVVCPPVIPGPRRPDWSRRPAAVR